MPLASTPRPRLVVIDDSHATAKALTRLLEIDGYDVIPLLTHAEAAAWLDANADQAPAAMLVDIHLPDGSGLDLAHRARDQYDAGLPIYILSGDTSMENLKALPGGATTFLAKPLHAPTLREELRAQTTARA